MFTQMVRDLMAAGLTQVEIAAAIQRSQATVSRILGGQEKIEWEVGEALRLLHAERCPQDQAAPPSGPQAAEVHS